MNAIGQRDQNQIIPEEPFEDDVDRQKNEINQSNIIS